MIVNNDSIFFEILGHILGVLFTIGLIMVLLENIFSEWFNKHIKKRQK